MLEWGTHKLCKWKVNIHRNINKYSSARMILAISSKFLVCLFMAIVADSSSNHRMRSSLDEKEGMACSWRSMRSEAKRVVSLWNNLRTQVYPHPLQPCQLGTKMPQLVWRSCLRSDHVIDTLMGYWITCYFLSLGQLGWEIKRVDMDHKPLYCKPSQRKRHLVCNKSIIIDRLRFYFLRLRIQVGGQSREESSKPTTFLGSWVGFLWQALIGSRELGE